MPDYSDAELIAQYLAGDEKSLEILIRRYLKPVYGFIGRYVGYSKEIEDIAQEVFVKVWRNLKKFDRDKNFKAWIFTIAKNAALDWLKKKKTIPFSSLEKEDGEDNFANSIVDPAPQPDELLAAAQAGEKLFSAVEQLPLNHRLVLSLYYGDHFNFREIAEILGKPLNTVKSRHGRALATLKKLLPEA